MHIKNIVISGFRSYRDQAFQEELSPKHNVVVGRNGSGKSNFFAAIQFVLSEKFSNLSAAERKDLFHAGAGRPLLAVFVEIIFDNSDGRIVIPGRPDESEVRIRRTVGLKQDEFRVNDRRFTSTEIRQLLESAGFSSSNPYYIVEQGKIVSLANMNEEDRYQLIKDVAGTNLGDFELMFVAHCCLCQCSMRSEPREFVCRAVGSVKTASKAGLTIT
jgi:structural maintenance of chromosome 3 (chondroitin sulfate proteoglycan 6)